MKTAAIICEYNPFHFGHNYQIQELRKILGEDTAVVSVMSGAFTQRGEVAIFDKFLRAKAAICGGKYIEKPDISETFEASESSGYADLVLELPSPWSMSGAEFFARAGVSIAKRIGADYLIFGGESSLPDIKKTANNLDSAEFKAKFEIARKENSSFSTNSLREKIYLEIFGSPLYRGSNDILAIEYLRALGDCKVQPLCIERVGEKYNPDGVYLSNNYIFSSASTIRSKILNENSSKCLIPTAAYEVLKNAQIHRMSNLDSVVTAYLRFSSQNMEGVEISGGIQNKLRRAAECNFGIENIVNACVERRFSASRLRRAIFGAMCGFSASDCELLPEYTQLLAANKRGCEVLAKLRKISDLCILTKGADGFNLPEKARKQFEANLRAESLWALSSDDIASRRADRLLRRNPFVVK